MLMTVSVYGDEYYDFVKLLCKEVEFLEIQSTGMSI